VLSASKCPAIQDKEAEWSFVCVCVCELEKLPLNKFNALF